MAFSVLGLHAVLIVILHAAKFERKRFKEEVQQYALNFNYIDFFPSPSQMAEVGGRGTEGHTEYTKILVKQSSSCWNMLTFGVSFSLLR